MLSIWDAAQPHATGVILFQNLGPGAVTIDPGLKVQMGPHTFQLWDHPLPAEYQDYRVNVLNQPPMPSLPFTLEAGRTLAVAETWNFNFDTKALGPGFTPVISGSINGMPFSFVDTKGILVGDGPPRGSEETTPYSFLGKLCPPDLKEVPEPASAALFGALALAGMVSWRVRRRISPRGGAA
jgi:hypothetical protein